MGKGVIKVSSLPLLKETFLRVTDHAPSSNIN